MTIQEPINDYLVEERETLIEKLREELQEYGALLNLLNEQQEAIIHREVSKLLELNKSVTDKVVSNDALKEQREHYVQSLLESLGVPKKKSVKDLMPFFNDSVQGLLQALIDEVFAVLEKIKRKAQQNQMLVSKMAQVTEEILQELQPHTKKTKTYSRNGAVKVNINKLRSYIAATA